MKREILKKHLLPVFGSEEEMEHEMCNKWDVLENAMFEYHQASVKKIKPDSKNIAQIQSLLKLFKQSKAAILKSKSLYEKGKHGLRNTEGYDLLLRGLYDMFGDIIDGLINKTEAIIGKSASVKKTETPIPSRPLLRSDLPTSRYSANSLHIPVLYKGKKRYICDIHFTDDTKVFLEGAKGKPTLISELLLISDGKRIVL